MFWPIPVGLPLGHVSAKKCTNLEGTSLMCKRSCLLLYILSLRSISVPAEIIDECLTASLQSFISIFPLLMTSRKCFQLCTRELETRSLRVSHVILVGT